jgi:glutathione S-transferase
MAEAHLYSLSLSHPSLAAKLALDRKHVDYRVSELVPGLHSPLLRALGFGAATVPALRIDDCRIQGSSQIFRYLERTRPEPPLFGETAGQAERIAAEERWGEEALQPVSRRLFRLIARQGQVRRWMAREVMGWPGARFVAPTTLPIALVMGRVAGTGEEVVRADIAELPALLDRVDALLEEGVIGDIADPNAADLQILTSIASLLAFADLEPAIGRRPCAAAARALVPALPGPVPEALPRAWLDPVQAGA